MIDEVSISTLREFSLLDFKLSHRNIRIDLDPFADPEIFEPYKNITRADWKPESVINHTPEFVSWVDSFLEGHSFTVRKYEPFIKYCAQAWWWLQDRDNIVEYTTDEAKREFKRREYNRIAENSLYYAEKYGELKEGDSETGVMRYKALLHHAIIFFLLDSGYNCIGGKGRQIGFTTALGLYATRQLIVRTNYYIKFVTEDEKTGEEIFNDKIKYPFSSNPKWLQPPVKSDSAQRFWLSNKEKKGQKGYPNSRLDVIAPKITAINGGSPQLVLIDEIGQIPILSEMLNEARPTMFWTDPQTGRFTLKRQVWMWGTGSKIDAGAVAYKSTWLRIVGLWNEKKLSGFVPIFFSWTFRLGPEDYKTEKSWYYGARAAEENVDLETSKTQFHQHYPTTWRDMFITTANTLVSREIIEDGLTRCLTLHPDLKPVYGYFEPVYDEQTPAGMGSDVPFKIIGANFVAVSDDDVTRAAVIMYERPEKGWSWRYFQGTDPIATETGRSKMASSIWDDHKKTFSCILNYRKKHDHKFVFLQTLLMGLYYGAAQGEGIAVKELVESNIGTNYIDYKEVKGYFGSLVQGTELPNKVMGGLREVGIDNKTTRADAIIDYMAEVFRMYHRNINIKLVFDQLLTFVQEYSRTGKEVWGTNAKSAIFNDVLYACAYAYICRLSYPNRFPVRETVSAVEFVVKHQLVRDKNNNLVRKPVRIPHVKVEEYSK